MTGAGYEVQGNRQVSITDDTPPETTSYVVDGPTTVSVPIGTSDSHAAEKRVRGSYRVIRPGIWSGEGESRSARV